MTKCTEAHYVLEGFSESQPEFHPCGRLQGPLNLLFLHNHVYITVEDFVTTPNKVHCRAPSFSTGALLQPLFLTLNLDSSGILKF